MTEKLYYADTYMREFDARVLSCEKNGKYYTVILDKTAFFPEGGGQPGDRGFIGSSEVIDTQIKDDIILHTCRSEASGDVHCVLDWDYRFVNMQQHTGEQIFTGFVHKEKGYDNVGFHIGDGEVTIDFNGPLTKEEIEHFEDEANDAIYRNIPIEIIYPKREELSDYDYRSKKEIEGQVRLVKIGDVDLCACCGTHTRLTGEVGIIKNVYAMSYKGGVRLTMKIGRKAFEDYKEKHNSVASVSAALCAKPAEIGGAVEKLKEKNAAERYENGRLRKELFTLRTEAAVSEFPVVFDDGGETENARILADMLADKVRIAYAFSGSDTSGYRYAVVSRTEDVRECAKAINTALNGRGGGKPEIAMGSVSCSREEIEKFFR